ncbi:hypothetical protein F8388_012033 [Cannabis sativa]|uniref:Ubiquitin-like protease family profile domain-containing protein n=1 Tax=Cannabis sativa TaxID=3483 RepID=A0A7J6GDU8_CANSA|nr:hypothetical protein F8388_012033 [Cannabis sativa]
MSSPQVIGDPDYFISPYSYTQLNTIEQEPHTGRFFIINLNAMFNLASPSTIEDDEPLFDDETEYPITTTENTVQISYETLMNINNTEALITIQDMFAADVSVGSEATKLPCTHAYHKQCVVEWLQEWDYIYDQKNLHDKEKVYLKGKDKIVPPFRFGVEDVATKMWFHKLAYPGQCLTNSHLDIIFYYLRKKGKYAKEPKVKFTTTDCLFFKTIHALYEKFIAQKKNLSLITAQHAIADYIRGRKMLCGSPWHLCDHVFFIIHMETESHWILGRLNIEERRVYMYNSLSTAMKDSAAIKACQPFAVLLPHFFALFDEFKKENKPICLDPFEVVKVDGLPQQTSNDCGCFVASFAEYFIDMKPIPPIFDVEKHRDRLAVLFYKYARMKEVEFIDSEDEAPPKGPKKNLS